MTRDLRVRDLLTHNSGLGNTDLLWARGDGPELLGMDLCELAPVHGSQVSETAAVKLLQRILVAWLGSSPA